MKSMVVGQILGSVNFELLGFFLEKFSFTVKLISLMEVVSFGLRRPTFMNKSVLHFCPKRLLLAFLYKALKSEILSEGHFT